MRVLLLLCVFIVQAHAGAEQECTREWAINGISNSSFKVIGLGVSTSSDSKIAREEAKSAAVKDILLQLQTNAQSKSEVKKTDSSSSYSSESVQNAKIDDLKGLKPIKSGKNAEEKISKCEVYEFNVQSAHQDLSSRLAPVASRLEKLSEKYENGKWSQVFKELPQAKKLVASRKNEIERADIFKTYLAIPGPTWEEKIDGKLTNLEEAEANAKQKFIFIIPMEGSFETAAAEASSALSASGIKVKNTADEIEESALPITVTIKEFGTPRKSKTRLGLTITRKVSITLADTRTKQVLLTNKGLSVVGTSKDGIEEDALTNTDQQIVGNIVNTIKNFAPNLIKN